MTAATRMTSGHEGQGLALAVGQVGRAEQVTDEHRHPQPDADDGPQRAAGGTDAAGGSAPG